MRLERKWDIIVERPDYFWPVRWKIILLNDGAVIVRESPWNIYARGKPSEWITERGHSILLYENEIVYEYSLEGLILFLKSVEEDESIIAGEWIIDFVDPRIVESLKENGAYFTCSELDD